MLLFWESKNLVPYFRLYELSLISRVKKTKEMLVMRDKLSFLYLHIWFDATKCKFIVKSSSLQCWLCFRLFLWRTQKMIYVCNFVAPLKRWLGLDKKSWKDIKKIIRVVLGYQNCFNSYKRGRGLQLSTGNHVLRKHTALFQKLGACTYIYKCEKFFRYNCLH